jgi:Family of unknown function (DUF5994)
MLPNHIHHANIATFAPGTPSPRLTLEPTGSGSGRLDGAWWPRSRDPRSELPGLIATLDDRLGVVLRVSLAMEAWDDLPQQITVGTRAVRVDWFPGADHTITVTRARQDHLMFLTVPPRTDIGVATAAMDMAAQTGNDATSAEILAAAGEVTVRRLVLVRAPRPGEDEQEFD